MNRPAFGGPASAGNDPEASMTFSDRDLADAGRLLAKIVGLPSSNEAAESVETAVFADSSDRAHLIKRARAAVERRKRRAAIFHRGMFGEPAWEMLLSLYVSHDGQCESIEGLRQTAEVTLTTALRWLDYLEGAKLIRRLEHRFDKRRVSIEITEKGRDMLDLYFSGTG